MIKPKLSNIVAGVMNWGIWGSNLSANEMEKRIHHCLENGITTFDHADIYGDYTTEMQFGEAFSSSQIAREKVQLITKCGIEHTKGRPNLVKHYNYSKEYIIWSAENSLKKLKTDYIDVLLLHRPSPLMQPAEIAEAVLKLKSEGKILDFGVSNFSSIQTELILQKIEVSYNQIQFSATHLEPMLNGSLAHMQIHHILPMCWNPLGSYFKGESEQNNRLKILLYQLEQKYNATADLLLIAWVLEHPANLIPVVGTTNLERIINLSKLKNLKLELIDWFAIWTESVGQKVP